MYVLVLTMAFPCPPQPSVSGMEPPFGDAFQNYSFVDQALTSTELLTTSSDPDFMYELVSSHTRATHTQSGKKQEWFKAERV